MRQLRTPSPPLVVRRSSIRGLVRRKLPFLPVFAQSVAAIAPSGTAAVTPPFVISAVGGGASVLVFLAAAVLAVCVALVIRPMAQRLAVTGGLYTYVAKGLGPSVAIPVGWSAIVGYGAVSVSSLFAVGTYLDQVAGAAGMAGSGSTVAIVLIVLVAATVAVLLMARGIRISAATTLLIECVSVAGILALMVFLMTRDNQTPRIPHDFVAPVDPGTLAISAVLAISAFVGFESATTLSSESYRPFRSVPRTLVWTPVAAGAIYLVAVCGQAVALSDGSVTVSESMTPVTDLLLRDNSAFLAGVVDLGIAASFFACTLASMNALVRVLFTMGREGIAPAVVGRAHPRFHTPAHAIVLSMFVVTSCAVVALLAGMAPQDGIRSFLTLSALGYLGSYLPACLAGPALLHRIRESSRVITVLGTVTAVLLALLVVAACFSNQSNNTELLLSYAAVMVASLVFTLGLRIFAPERLRGVGIYDEPLRADLLQTETFR
ncbi:APC family permease [Nocardia sp. NBC_01388]|uniref:APC family permease n=1 Tax=Nocardia sp. NBC_01388 TaxID=2903596 RepID=UPI0032529FD2